MRFQSCYKAKKYDQGVQIQIMKKYPNVSNQISVILPLICDDIVVIVKVEMSKY